MNTNVDWLSAIRGPDVPPSIRRTIHRADKAFLQKEGADVVAEELVALDEEISSDLYEYLRCSLGVHAGLLERQFVAAVQNDQTIEHCFTLFKKLSRVGFASPVHKSRIVIILLRYLEDRLTPLELRPLVEAMADELERLRVGCEENLSILRTFLKPDDLTERIP
jgi:hypothetical protein